MTQFADQLALLALAVVLGAELVIVVWKRPTVGLWLFMAAYLAAIAGWRFEAIVLGFQVYPLDIIAATLLTASILRVRSLATISRPVAVIAILIALAIARGLSEFGAATAVNGARELIYLAVGVIFARVCLAGRWDSIESVWFAAAGVLGVVAVLFVARNGLGTYSTTGDRPLNSGQALIVAQASLLALTTSRAGRWRLASILGFGLLVLSQQRTVWAATVAMALVLTYHPGRSHDRTARRSVRIGLLAAFLATIAVVLFSPAELRSGLTTATSDVTADNSTLSWRTESWGSFLDDFSGRSIGEKLVGHPSGTVLERLVNDIVRTESAHNMYVTTLVSLGALGLMALVAMYVTAMKRSWTAQPTLAALIAGLCVFSIGYQIASVQGIWIGFALGLTALREKSPNPISVLQRS